MRALVAGAITVAAAASNPPTPGPLVSTAKQQAQAASAAEPTKEDQRGTGENPLLVRGEVRAVVEGHLTTEKTAEDTAKEANDKKDKLSNERVSRYIEIANTSITALLAVITGLLAWFTKGLWSSTSNLVNETIGAGKRQASEMERSLNIAEKAVKAANIQAKAIRSSERAYLFIEVLSEAELANDWSNDITVKVWNYGKTAAELVRIRAYPVHTNEKMEELHSYAGSDRTLPPGLGLAPNVAFPIIVSTDYTPGEALRVVGCITYKDIFGKERSTGFDWFYRRGMPVGEAPMMINPDSPLNYRT